jgi:hypothetical protein
MSDTDQRQTRRWIMALVLALAAWGLYNAVGAYLFNHDIRRGVVVTVAMAAFLAWWLLLLRLNSKTKNRPSP